MVAEHAPSPDRFERAMTVVRELIAARGIGRFATFWEVDEGTIFPDGTESISGHVIAEDGRHFFFWTDWDPARGGPTLGTWRQVEQGVTGTRSEEYVQARRAVGLATAPDRV